MKTLRIYSEDPDFYEGYISKLADEARAGFGHALERMRESVRRFAAAGADEIRASASIDDARLVYACEHGFEDWSVFAAHLRAIASGQVAEPFIQAIRAAEGGDLEVAQRLFGADTSMLDAVASTAKTPLHSAMGGVTEHLIELGADVEQAFPLAGGTALIHALIWGRRDKAELLARHSLAPNNLRVAAGLGRLDLLERCFDATGALVSAARAERDYYRPNYGWYPWTPSDDTQEVLDEALVYAATSGRVEELAYLVERGADVNGLAYETPALLRAAWQGQAEAIEWLLEQGADIDALGQLGGHAQGVTALHLAASSGHVALVKQLVERGADATVRDPLYDGTPQGWANHNRLEGGLDDHGRLVMTEIRDYLREVEAS